MEQTNNTDTLKGLAIVAVVGIHLLASLQQLDKLHLHFLEYLRWDSWLRFCVPVFVAVSGYGLTRKYLQRKLQLREFWEKRLLRLLPLYFLWSGIFVLTAYFVPAWSAFIAGASPWNLVFLGRSDYHLYFVPMIVQLYLLFPILFWLAKKNKALLLLAALMGEIYFFHLIGTKTESGNSWRQFYSDQEQYIFFGTWIVFFVLGIVLGLKKPVIKLWHKLLFWALAIWGSLWVAADTQHLLRAGTDALVATRFTRIPVIAFGSGVVLAGVTLKIRKNPLAWLGKNSYLIYLSHTLLLRIIFSFLDKTVDNGMLVGVFLIWVTGIIISVKYEN